MVIEFGAWLPDQPTLDNPGCVVAKNCLPLGRGYKPMPSAVSRAPTLTARCRGAYTCVDLENNPFNFAGDATKLYRLTASALNISGATYTTSADEFWEFAKYGEQVIATNYNDAVQVYTLGVGTFAALGGSPPRARHAAVVRDFVVLGNLDGASNRVQWSDKGNATNWAVGGSSQADSFDLVGDAGPIQKIIGGEAGIIFQKKQIWRMVYSGAPAFFQVDPVELNRGALIPGGVVNVGATIYFLDSDGFYSFSGVSVPIGSEKVNKWFFDNLSYANRSRITSAADPARPIVYWSFPSNASSDGTPDTILAYNWTTQRWSYLSLSHQMLTVLAVPGYTLEELDAFGTLDALLYSLDADYWKNGKLNLSCFNTSNVWQEFTGSAMTATIQSREVNLNSDGKATVTRIYPRVDGGTTTLRVGERNAMADAVSFGSSLSPNTISKSYKPRSTARYHTVEATITGGFTDATGVEVQAVPRGRR